MAQAESGTRRLAGRSGNSAAFLPSFTYSSLSDSERVKTNLGGPSSSLGGRPLPAVSLGATQWRADSLLPLGLAAH